MTERFEFTPDSLSQVARALGDAERRLNDAARTAARIQQGLDRRGWGGAGRASGALGHAVHILSTTAGSFNLLQRDVQSRLPAAAELAGPAGARSVRGARGQFMAVSMGNNGRMQRVNGRPIARRPLPIHRSKLPVTRRMLQLGMKGRDVKVLQRLLNAAGAYPPLKVDGKFGKDTYKALRAFQSRRGLPVDGIAGKQSWGALYRNAGVYRDVKIGNRDMPAGKARIAPTKGSQSHSPTAPPPPRVYVINGIGSKAREGEPDSFSKDFEKMMKGYGYKGRIVPTVAVYNENNPRNGGLDRARDVVDVVKEYRDRERGHYTQKVYQDILADIARNPLKKGEKIILVGHSGGGAIAANLSGMLEQEYRSPKRKDVVAGVVTLGSPVANYDYAHQWGNKVVQIRDAGDWIGTPILRSEESRHNDEILKAAAGSLLSPRPQIGLPANLITQELRDRDNSPSIVRETLHGRPGGDPWYDIPGHMNPIPEHSSYPRENSAQVAGILEREFGLSMPRRP